MQICAIFSDSVFQQRCTARKLLSCVPWENFQFMYLCVLAPDRVIKYIVAYNLNNIATLNHIHLFIADLFFLIIISTLIVKNWNFTQWKNIKTSVIFQIFLSFFIIFSNCVYFLFLGKFFFFCPSRDFCLVDKFNSPWFYRIQKSEPFSEEIFSS